VPIAQAMGLDVTRMPAADAVELLAEEIRRLGDEVGVPGGLGALGVTEDDIPRLSELTLGDACLTTNPRATSVEEIETLFKAAL
jgi:alcohol dehydrogenase class IV